jgi:hypothetical protein
MGIGIDTCFIHASSGNSGACDEERNSVERKYKHLVEDEAGVRIDDRLCLYMFICKHVISVKKAVPEIFDDEF